MATTLASGPRQAPQGHVPPRPLPIRHPEAPDAPKRPLVREECLDGPRPCPWVTCRYHMFVEVAPKLTKISLCKLHKLGMDDLGDLLKRMEYTCALDAIRPHQQTLEEVGAIFHITRERVRQIEKRATKKLEKAGRRVGVGVDILDLLRR